MVSGTADPLCLPCRQDPCPWTEGNISTTATLHEATKSDSGTDTNLSDDPPLLATRPTSPRSTSAQQQRQSITKHPCNEKTPNILPPEDTAIGNGHRSTAASVSAKQLTQSKGGDTGRRATYLDLIAGPFFVECFSGSGRMAASVRKHGLDAFEFDLTE